MSEKAARRHCCKTNSHMLTSPEANTVILVQSFPLICGGYIPSSLKGRLKTWIIVYMYVWGGASLKAQLVKDPPAMQENTVQFLAQDDLLEKA